MKNNHRIILKDDYYSGDLADDAYEIAEDYEGWIEVLADATELLKNSGEHYNTIKEDVEYAIHMANKAFYELNHYEHRLNNLLKNVDKVKE